ncbi:MAG: hypothetical protein NZM37_07775 [Sandaracinaceae bacterium]|nr:hypothetical protein [Sandaracinaceae bacterium]
MRQHSLADASIPRGAFWWQSHRLGPLALAWLAVACGGNGTPRSDGGSLEDTAIDAPSDVGDTDNGQGDARNEEVPAGLRAFCERLASLACEEGERCNCGRYWGSGGVERASCTSRLSEKCLEEWSRLVGRRHRFDESKARACAEFLVRERPTCSRLSLAVQIALCEPFFFEEARIGQACEGIFCDEGRGFCEEGMCKRRKQEGEACSAPQECGRGLVCLGQCRRLGAEGAPCDLTTPCEPRLRCVSGRCRSTVGEGEACAGDEQCQVGLRCQGGRCQRSSSCHLAESACNAAENCFNLRRCQAPGEAGTPCSDDSDCAPAFYCSGTSPNMTCQPRPTRNMPCGDGVVCAEGLGCSTPSGGTCQPLPGEGAECLLGRYGPFLCAPGLACVDGRCRPLPGEGQTCGTPDVCAPGLGCAFGPEGSICIRPREEGASCENNQACARGLVCVGGRCTLQPRVGDPCNPASLPCLDSACVPDRSGTFRCQPLRANGERCDNHRDCQEGLRCRPGSSECVPLLCIDLLAGG